MSRQAFETATSQLFAMNDKFDRVRPISITLGWFAIALGLSFTVIAYVYLWTGESKLSATIQSGALVMTMGGFLLMAWSGVDRSRILEEMALCRTILTIGEQRELIIEARLRQARNNGQHALTSSREQELASIKDAIDGASKRLNVLGRAKRFVAQATKIGGRVSIAGIFLTPFSGFF